MRARGGRFRTHVLSNITPAWVSSFCGLCPYEVSVPVHSRCDSMQGPAHQEGTCIPIARVSRLVVFSPIHPFFLRSTFVRIRRSSEPLILILAVSQNPGLPSSPHFFSFCSNSSAAILAAIISCVFLSLRGFSRDVHRLCS